MRKLINENENYIVTLSLVSYDVRKRINRAPEAYYKAHGNLKMPHDYEDENDIWIEA